jgi:hypothetical protein
MPSTRPLVFLLEVDGCDADLSAVLRLAIGNWRQPCYISPKTTDHHIQHVYGKIGVSTRGAAALWAMQHAVVQ